MGNSHKMMGNSTSPGKDTARHMEAAKRFSRCACIIEEITKKNAADQAGAADYARRASAYMRLGRFREAASDYEKAVGLEPMSPAHYMNLSYSLLCLDKDYLARASLLKVLEFNPSERRALFMLARLESDADNFKQAKKYYSRSVGLYMRDSSTSPAKLKKMLFEYASACELCKDFMQAVRTYGRISHMFPDDAKAYERLGYCKVMLKKYSESIVDLEKSLALEPENPKSLINMGVALINLKKADAAIAFLNKSLLVDGDHLGLALFNRSIAHTNMGKYDIALADLDNAATLDSSLAQDIENHRLLINSRILEN